MGLPGNFAFSFLRGAKVEFAVQKAARMGILVNNPKKRVVLKPPPNFQERYQGTMARREKRAMLEKDSLPAPSAGRGAFLMAGYFFAH
jgi:hypothetical protein